MNDDIITYINKNDLKESTQIKYENIKNNNIFDQYSKKNINNITTMTYTDIFLQNKDDRIAFVDLTYHFINTNLQMNINYFLKINNKEVLNNNEQIILLYKGGNMMNYFYEKYLGEDIIVESIEDIDGDIDLNKYFKISDVDYSVMILNISNDERFTDIKKCVEKILIISLYQLNYFFNIKINDTLQNKENYFYIDINFNDTNKYYDINIIKYNIDNIDNNDENIKDYYDDEYDNDYVDEKIKYDENKINKINTIKKEIEDFMIINKDDNVNNVNINILKIIKDFKYNNPSNLKFKPFDNFIDSDNINIMLLCLIFNLDISDSDRLLIINNIKNKLNYKLNRNQIKNFYTTEKLDIFKNNLKENLKNIYYIEQKDLIKDEYNNITKINVKKKIYKFKEDTSNIFFNKKKDFIRTTGKKEDNNYFYSNYNNDYNNIHYVSINKNINTKYNNNNIVHFDLIRSKVNLCFKNCFIDHDYEYTDTDTELIKNIKCTNSFKENLITENIHNTKENLNFASEFIDISIIYKDEIKIYENFHKNKTGHDIFWPINIFEYNDEFKIVLLSYCLDDLYLDLKKILFKFNKFIPWNDDKFEKRIIRMNTLFFLYLYTTKSPDIYNTIITNMTDILDIINKKGELLPKYNEFYQTFSIDYFINNINDINEVVDDNKNICGNLNKNNLILFNYKEKINDILINIKEYIKIHDIYKEFDDILFFIFIFYYLNKKDINIKNKILNSFRYYNNLSDDTFDKSFIQYEKILKIFNNFFSNEKELKKKILEKLKELVLKDDIIEISGGNFNIESSLSIHNKYIKYINKKLEKLTINNNIVGGGGGGETILIKRNPYSFTDFFIKPFKKIKFINEQEIIYEPKLTFNYILKFKDEVKKDELKIKYYTLTI